VISGRIIHFAITLRNQVIVCIVPFYIPSGFLFTSALLRSKKSGNYSMFSGGHAVFSSFAADRSFPCFD
jgi:hypothetical protein